MASDSSRIVTPSKLLTRKTGREDTRGGIPGMPAPGLSGLGLARSGNIRQSWSGLTNVARMSQNVSERPERERPRTHGRFRGSRAREELGFPGGTLARWTGSRLRTTAKQEGLGKGGGLARQRRAAFQYTREAPRLVKGCGRQKCSTLFRWPAGPLTRQRGVSTFHGRSSAVLSCWPGMVVSGPTGPHDSGKNTCSEHQVGGQHPLDAAAVLPSLALRAGGGMLSASSNAPAKSTALPSEKSPRSTIAPCCEWSRRRPARCPGSGRHSPGRGPV